MHPIVTSVTLLKAISNDTATARWTEFFEKYERYMRNYLESHFPTLVHDDIIQETMMALIDRLPSFRYTPDSKGHFRGYLTGILKHKALEQLRKAKRQPIPIDCTEESSGVETDGDQDPYSHWKTKTDEEECRQWQDQAMEAAIEQFLIDESIDSRNREIFRHVALMHESPESVAQKFGITRGNVDVIKNRMIKRLSVLVEKMTELD